MYALLLTALVGIVPFVASLPFVEVPVYYVTESDITSSPKETILFGVKTCGGKQYEHYTGTVYINFPDKKWNPFAGDFVYASVSDAHGDIIATNSDHSGDYSTEFSFIYHSVNGDLIINITAGNAPVFKYTLTVTFTNPASTNATRAPISPMLNRYVQTAEEVKAWENIKEMHPKQTVHDLVTVFKTVASSTVATADVVGFELQYCFVPDEFPGYLTISTLATDEKSGFATYVCTHDVQCNSVGAAKFYDVSGASVNFVHVIITAESAGPIKILVRGDGRFTKENHFVLAASKYVQSK